MISAVACTTGGYMPEDIAWKKAAAMTSRTNEELHEGGKPQAERDIR